MASRIVAVGSLWDGLVNRAEAAVMFGAVAVETEYLELGLVPAARFSVEYCLSAPRTLDPSIYMVNSKEQRFRFITARAGALISENPQRFSGQGLLVPLVVGLPLLLMGLTVGHVIGAGVGFPLRPGGQVVGVLFGL